jgi:hypothetical protein
MADAAFLVNTALHAKVAAVAPIVGVSVGSVDDKATWRIDFDPKATDAQRKAAQAVIDAFDVAAEQSQLEVKEVRDQKIAGLADILIAKGIITEQDLN